MSDEMLNETSPGVQSRRYRLLAIADLNGADRSMSVSGSIAYCEIIGDGAFDGTPKVIDAAFFPITPTEYFAFHEETRPWQGIDPEDLPAIEYEVTVRRITPMPDPIPDPDNPYGLDFGDWKDGQE